MKVDVDAAMMSKTRPHFRQGATGSESGNAIVEFVIVVPLLVLLLGGIVDYGAAVSDRAAIVEAARVGAREAAHSFDPQDTATITQKARDVVGRVLSGAGYDPSRYQTAVSIVDFPLGDGTAAKAVQVTVSADAGLRSFMFLPSRSVRETASSTYRLEFALLPDRH